MCLFMLSDFKIFLLITSFKHFGTVYFGVFFKLVFRYFGFYESAHL